MRWLICVAAALALAAVVPDRQGLAANIGDFLEYSLLDTGGHSLLPGRLYVPASYTTDPTTPRPIILFLHGAGESGTNNTSQVNENIDNLLAAAKARGAFLYAPQSNLGWGNVTLFNHAMTMIDRAITEKRADPNRIYVTGLSMGGGGTWNFLSQFPDRVAAAAPLCGVPPWPGFDSDDLYDEPIWAFHGRLDETVSATVTRNTIDSLLAAGGQPAPTYPALFTRGPNVTFNFPPLDLHYTDLRETHGIWTQVYGTPALYDWMFAHGIVPEPATSSLVLGPICAFYRRRARGSTTESPFPAGR